MTMNINDFGILQIPFGADSIPLAQKGVADGVATLDGTAKIPLGQIPDSVLGQVSYQGVWNANTNSPALGDSGAGGSQGDYYIVSVAGTTSIDGISDWQIGDWIINNGTTWDKIDNTDLVPSVFGRTGAIVALPNDYTWAQIDKTVSDIADIATKSHASLSDKTADDHTQYLLANGSRGLLADWDAGSWKVKAETLESDIAPGNPPLIVASNDLVTNLNADKLDSQEGSYYLDSANFSGVNWTDLTDGGATTLHSHASSVVAFYDATVGPSGDYTTLKAAVDAGKKYILVIGNTTETADIAVPSTGLYLFIQSGATINMGDNQFTFAATANVTIRGNGGTIQYALTGATVPLFDNGVYASTSTIDTDGIKIDNNSTATFSPFSKGIDIVHNVEYSLPNAARGGYWPNGQGSIYQNVHFIGGGASCTHAIVSTARVRVSDLRFTGTFSSVGNALQFDAVNSVANNLLFDNLGTITYIGLVGDIANINVDGNPVHITVGFSDCRIANANLSGGNIDLSSFGNISLVNIRTSGLIDLTDVNVKNILLHGCRLERTGVTTINGDRIKFCHCDILGPITVASGANDNSFSNCQIGPDGGAGPNTITVASGSNRTRIVGCMLDSTIVNNGTGTVDIGNTVY